jgi:hypothetical protein
MAGAKHQPYGLLQQRAERLVLALTSAAGHHWARNSETMLTKSCGFSSCNHTIGWCLTQVLPICGMDLWNWPNMARPRHAHTSARDWTLMSDEGVPVMHSKQKSRLTYHHVPFVPWLHM